MRDLIKIIEEAQSDDAELRHATAHDIPGIKACFERAFGRFGFNGDYLSRYLSDPTSVTFVIVSQEEVRGFYLLSPKNLEEKEYQGMWGIEGVALALDKQMQGRGLGKKMIELPKTLGYDYVWGMQLKALNNIDHWLKRRQPVAQTDSEYITAEVFNKAKWEQNQKSS